MTRRRFVAGIALAAALALGACAGQAPTFAEPGITDPPAPRDTTGFAVPGAPAI
jgi:hypothetical protein